MSYNISDLRVIDFIKSRIPDKHIKSWMTNGMRSWSDRVLSKRIGRPEDCDRKIWWGHVDHFTTPARSKSGKRLAFNHPGQPNNACQDDIDNPVIDADKYPSYQYLKGEDAYRFLLTFICGVLNHSYDASKYQTFMTDYGSMLFSQDGELAEEYEDIISALNEDYSLLERYRKALETNNPKDNIIARDLSGQKPGDRVLLIADKDKYGALSEDTRNLSKTISRMKDSAGNLVCSECINVLHPDAESNLELATSIEDEFEHCHVPTHVDCVNADDDWLATLAKEIEENDVIYVTFDVWSEKNAERAREIAYCWNNRAGANTDGKTMIIYSTQPEHRNINLPECFDGMLDVYGPRHFETIVPLRIRNFEVVIDLLRQAIDICANRRNVGTAPTVADIRATEFQFKMLEAA